METKENIWEKQFEDIISENFQELKTGMSLQNGNFKITTQRKIIVNNPREKITYKRMTTVHSH